MSKQSAKSRRPVTKPTSTKNAPVKGSKGTLFTWLSVGVVVVVIAVLVIVKTTSGGANGSGANNSGFGAVSPTVLSELTGVPLATFNAVGVTSGAGAVTAPTRLKNQTELETTGTSGTSVPEVFYEGAEFCPYCAAERWATIIALSRFGTWSGLQNMVSSTHAGEAYPGTPTFTFAKATYSSAYLAFKEVESETRVWDNAVGFYTPFQKATTSEAALVKKYDTTKFIPALPTSDVGAIPFLDFANEYVSAGASYNPGLLADQSRNSIAAGLSNAQSPITQAILATANYQSAALCTLTGNRPGSVCLSAGVKAAKKALGE